MTNSVLALEKRIKALEAKHSHDLVFCSKMTSICLQVEVLAAGNNLTQSDIDTIPQLDSCEAHVDNELIHFYPSSDKLCGFCKEDCSD